MGQEYLGNRSRCETLGSTMGDAEYRAPKQRTVFGRRLSGLQLIHENKARLAHQYKAFFLSRYFNKEVSLRLVLRIESDKGSTTPRIPPNIQASKLLPKPHIGMSEENYTGLPPPSGV